MNRNLLTLEAADLDHIAELVAAKVAREVGEILQSKPEDGERFTVKEVSKRFSISERTVRRAIESGDLVVERIGGCIRITRESLENWKSIRKNQHASDNYKNPMKEPRA